MATNKQLYVLDTNVLVSDPKAIYSFAGSYVGIPSIVLEELDEFKKESSDRGRNTREVVRQLDHLRTKGSFAEGVPLDNGSILKVLFIDPKEPIIMPFRLNVEDNEILLTALINKAAGFDVRFVSKDLNARIKADALGLQAIDYTKESVSQDAFYRGWTRLPVPAVQLKKDVPDDLQMLLDDQELYMNEFVIVESQHNPFNYRIFRYMGGRKFVPVYEPQFKWPLRSRNPQQLMALNLLLDDSIQFVTLFGPAGTGKTFLGLLAGLHKVLVENIYRKILISRPVVPLGRDLGYLPGTVEEKLHSWMLPIYDNIDFIVHAGKGTKHLQQITQEHQDVTAKGNHHEKRKHKKREFMKQGGEAKGDASGLGPVGELVRHDKLSLEAITYMRGRSIPYQFILIDEVQNLTPHEVKTLVSRVGEGSKIVLTGDPYQIDSPYLDFSSNGLVVTSDKFKGERLFGTVYLETSERSELSRLAGELL